VVCPGIPKWTGSRNVETIDTGPTNRPKQTDARHIGTYGKIVKVGTRGEIAHFVVHKGEGLPARVDL